MLTDVEPQSFGGRLVLGAAIVGAVILIVSIFTPRSSDVRLALTVLAAALCGPQILLDFVCRRRS